MGHLITALATLDATGIFTSATVRVAVGVTLVRCAECRPLRSAPELGA